MPPIIASWKVIYFTYGTDYPYFNTIQNTKWPYFFSLWRSQFLFFLGQFQRKPLFSFLVQLFSFLAKPAGFARPCKQSLPGLSEERKKVCGGRRPAVRIGACGALDLGPNPSGRPPAPFFLLKKERKVQVAPKKEKMLRRIKAQVAEMKDCRIERILLCGGS